MDSNTADPTQKWIFGSFYKDFSWLHLPGILVALIVLLAPAGSNILFATAFFVMIVLDMGHVYMTLYRSYFDRQERNRSKIYVLAPPFIFFLLFFASQSPILLIPLQVAFYAARTIHSVRQTYGISKWYEKKNGIFYRNTDNLFYLIAGCPVLYTILSKTQWIPIHYLLFSPAAILKTLIWFYIAFVFAWVVFEIKRWSRMLELNRILSIGMPIIFYSMHFLPLSLPMILLPLSTVHAVTYLGATRVALFKTNSPLVAHRFWGSLILPATLGIGVLSHFLYKRMLTSPNQIIASLSVFSLTFFFCHVLIDSFIWRGNHPDAALIYS